MSWPVCGVTKKTEGLPEDSRCSSRDFNQALPDASQRPYFSNWLTESGNESVPKTLVEQYSYNYVLSSCTGK